MTGEHKVFDKFITPGRRKGSVVIRSASSGNISSLQNPAKEKYIPPELVENLQSIVVRAFPKEFQGMEGFSKEEELLKGMKQRYPTEQPHEVWRRTIATLAGDGLTVEDIVGSLFSTNGKVYTALNLGTMSKAEQNRKMKKVGDAIRYYWPSAPNIE